MPQVDQLPAARLALRRGQDALAAGRVEDARAILDYAHRLAPKDGLVALTAATARLRCSDPAAAALFETLANAHDLREAWLGLASARRMAGDAAGAAAALDHALRGHALPGDPQIEALCDAIAAEAGAPGWCALDAGGRLRFGPAGLTRIAVQLDEAVLRVRGAAPIDLPAGWRAAQTLLVSAGRRALIGSAPRIDRIARVEGFVETRDGGLNGWAWHPADPDRAPALVLHDAAGQQHVVLADDVTIAPDSMPPLARPRGFAITAAMLAGLQEPLRVVGGDGRDLYGSPVYPSMPARSARAAARIVARQWPARSKPAEADHASDPDMDYPMPAIAASARGDAPTGPARKRRIDVVIPVYRGLEETLACVQSVLATVPKTVRVVVVDDASPDEALVAALLALADEKRIVLIRQPRNGGFPAAANAGLLHGPDRDVVLLNSDTLVPPGWLERLQAAALSAPEIGTVTPLSNDATILSYPHPETNNPVPDAAATVLLDQAAWRANGATLVDIPTGVGFCLYIRRDCLAETGLLRQDVFAQGYGEENDFCLRARHLGWRHVGHAGVFVAHVGGRSFGGAKQHLIQRNLEILDQLHPRYDRLIERFEAADPLAACRRAIDWQRWQDGAARESVILITHARGGGVARRVRERSAAIAAEGLRPVVLTPWEPDDSTRHQETAPEPGCCVADGTEDGAYPNLVFRWRDEQPALVRLLQETRPRAVELHHFIGHDPDVASLHRLLGVPQWIVAHDYALFCPRVALVTGTHRYCGEPDLATCDACVADYGTALEERISATALVRRSAGWLAESAGVIAPSADTARRIGRHFPGVQPQAQPWEPDPAPAWPIPRMADGWTRICVLGAIGIEKGYEILLACARDAARRALPLAFTVVGYTIDDWRLIDTGRVRVTGPYAAADAGGLIAAQGAQWGFLPSVWPETWCYTLSEMWQAGLNVAAFDLGAPAERIRRTGRGMLLPLGTPPETVNDILIRQAAA